MNQGRMRRVNCLRISTSAIFRCTRFSRKSRDKKDGLQTILALRATGSRTGWWGASQATEAFLDQVITWRELGFNCCQTRNRL